MSHATRDELLTQDLPEADVPTSRGMVRARALTASEYDALKGSGLSLNDIEVLLLATAVVNPKVTADDVVAWKAVARHGEIEAVAAMIWKLSS